MSLRSSRRPPIRERAREAAAEAILDAAEAVAAERGLEATSTAAIAERAGVAVGTLYNYFPDREHLLAALFEARRGSLVPRVAAAAAAAVALPFEVRLRAYLDGVFAAFEDHRSFLRVVISAAQSHVEFHGRSNIVLPKIAAELEAILRPVAGDAAPLHARLMLGAIKAAVDWRIAQGEPLAPDAPRVADAFLRGIAP